MDFADWLREKGRACAEPRDHLLSPGQEIGGWRVCAYLAHGGTSEVYRVERRETVAALKIARDPAQANISERFAREAGLLRQLHSRYFADLFDSGTFDGHAYLVTELLRPLELPTDDDDVAALATHLTNALAELHRIGHVHRDVKPTNVLTRDGQTPVLVDLGYAKPFSERPALPDGNPLSIEQSRVVGLGTPGYAAPEQFTGEDLTPAADIHALGVLLNDCFGGHPPRDWQPLVRRATSSLTSQRYASMTEFCRAIRRRHVRRRLLLAPLLLFATLATAFAVRTVIVMATRQIEEARTCVYVDGAAPDGGDGSRRHPFNTLSNALHQVPWFGTVVVAPGTYDGPLNLDEKCITVRSERGPEHTTLRVPTNETVATVYIGNRGEGSTLEGFTLTGGNGVAIAGSKCDELVDRFGGGLYCCCSATIRNCRIVGNGRRNLTMRERVNAPYLGGGVFVNGGNVTMTDCLVASNCAWSCGGGLCVSGTNACLVLQNCDVLDNVAEGAHGRVGGLALADHGSATVVGCRFFGNSGVAFGAVPGELATDTTLSVLQSRIEGGARAGGIRTFHADPESMTPAAASDSGGSPSAAAGARPSP